MASNLRRERTVFKDSLISDWKRLDVAYYVKHLGGGTSGQVDHISQGGVVATIPGGARITGGDTFRIVKEKLNDLPDDEELETLFDSIKNKVTRP